MTDTITFPAGDHASAATVPALGLGTWRLSGDTCRRAVADALELGYRHLDTAQSYGNEAEVGAGLRDAAVDRDDVVVTTKLPDDALDDVDAATADSLRALGLDVVDLLLVHWPATDERRHLAALERMFALRDAGTVRHVGVSNFTSAQLRRAAELGPIACDQVEHHPFLGQSALRDTARELGVAVVAYAPLARGRVFDDPTIVGIAEAHGRTPGQVALRWLLDQDDVAAVPKATSREHLAANLDLDLALDDDQRRAIDGLARGERLIDPPWAPAWDPAS